MNNYLSLITIITVCYNAEEHIEDTIKSIINQNYKYIEYIIIDGGSSDGTLDIIKKYKDKIDYFISEKDDGIYDAMNKGISKANGEYLLFLNAGDDFCDTDTLSNIFSKKDFLNEDIIYGSSIVVDTDRTKEILLKPKLFTKFNLLFWTTRTVCHQAIFVKKNIVVPYSKKYKLKGELNWYFDIEDKSKSYRIVDIPVVYYSLGGTGDINYKLNSIETLQVVFRRAGVFGIVSLPITLYKYLRKVFS